MSPKTETPKLRNLQTVRVRKDDLLLKLNENRKEHRQIFEEAIDGWKNEVIKILSEAVEDAKKGKDYRVSFYLPRPEDHTSDYDHVIAMLEMSLDVELELTHGEFRQFVMDEWGWQHTFLTSTASYSAVANDKLNKLS